MTRKNDDLIRNNEQYVKQRTHTHGENFNPRGDTPQKNPGKVGRQYPDLENWTLDELRQHARSLNLTDAETLDRDNLVEAIYQHQARMH